MVTELAQWRVKHDIKHNVMAELLTILKPRCPELPKDARTLMHMTEREVNVGVKIPVKAVSDGYYYHFGIQTELFYQLEQPRVFEIGKTAGEISIQLNVDGVPVFKSTNGQFWPILGKIDKPFDGRPFVIGFFMA